MERAQDLAEGMAREDSEQFRIDARDFLSARERGGTRALIYEQRAEDIYDLVGESTQKFLDSLNEQFLPAVRFTNANISP